MLIAVFGLSNAQSQKIDMSSKHINGPQYQKDQIIVKLKSNVDLSAVDNFAARISTPSKYFGISSIDGLLQPSGAITVKKLFPNSVKIMQSRLPNSIKKSDAAQTLERYYKVILDGNTPVERIKTKLERDPNVEKVEYSYIYEAYDVPNDELFSGLQHFPQIKASEAWSIHKGEKGPEIIIGINDSGTQWDHPDLFSNLKINNNEWTNKNEPLFIDQNGRKVINPAAVDGMDSDGNGFVDDVVGYNFFPYDNTAENDPYGSSVNRHGTHVAGIAAGVTNNSVGIASISWNVKFLPTKHSGNSDGRSLYNLEDGLWFLTVSGVNIVNMSWGGGPNSEAMAALFAYMHELGIILISSAGNNNNEVIQYPSSYPYILSVASVASTDAKAWYSTYGIQADISSPGGDSRVDGGFNSTVPMNSYARFQGTSMASPLVAGLAALIKSYRPDWSADKVMKQIVGTADPIDALNPQYAGKLGSGRINAFRAITESNVTVSAAPRIASFGTTYYNQNGNQAIVAGDEINFEITVRNFNQFEDAGALVFKLVPNNQNITAKNASVVKYIKADDMVKITGLSANVKPEAKPSFINSKIIVENLDGQFITQFSIDYMISGGILVYESFPESGHVSGQFIAQELTDKGFDVLYTNKMPQSFIGFTSAFLSLGSYEDGSIFEPYWEDFYAMADYLSTGGKLFMDGSHFFSSQLVGAIDPNDLGALFGITDAFTTNEETTVSLVKGQPGTIAQGMQFNSTNEYGYYIESYVPSSYFGGKSFLVEESFGDVGVQTSGMFGQKVVLMNFALAGYNDNDCPSTKSILLDNILSFFGEVKPITLTMPAEFGMCKGAGSVVLTPGNTFDCATNSMQNMTVTGGSGSYTYDWNPKTNMTNSNTKNPTVTNLNNNTSYKLKVTDNVYGISAEITTVVKVSQAPVVNARPLVQEKVNTIRNINSYILNYSNNNTYYWYRTSTANPISAATAMAWKVPMGTTQLIVEAVNSTGCKSSQQKVIVYGSLLKDNEDVVEGLTGTSLMLAYPTVTSDLLNVTAQFDSENSYRINIVDLLGNVVMQVESGTANGYDGSVNVSNLTAGTYMLVIETTTDRLIKKFVKM
jgi:hypothetical protein